MTYIYIDEKCHACCKPWRVFFEKEKNLEILGRIQSEYTNVFPAQDLSQPIFYDFLTSWSPKNPLYKTSVSCFEDSEWFGILSSS